MNQAETLHDDIQGAVMGRENNKYVALAKGQAELISGFVVLRGVGPQTWSETGAEFLTAVEKYADALTNWWARSTS